MDADFWRAKWAAQDINFHQADFNPLLTSQFRKLGIPAPAHVFVPLCGKSRDMVWLLREGYRVSGAELSEIAVEQFFNENGLTPVIAREGALARYSAPELDLFAGDIFELTADRLGPVDAVFDRAALVALPDALRQRYAAHLHAITKAAPQFLLTFEYDQTQMNGPPFSLPADLVAAAHGARFTQAELARRSLPGKLKDRVDAQEVAWALNAVRTT